MSERRLFKHQEEGVGFLLENSVAALLWEMGTGKTTTVLHALEQRHRNHGLRTAVVWAPLSILGVWEAEAGQTLTVQNRVLTLHGEPKRRAETLRQAATSFSGLTLLLINYELAIKLEKDLAKIGYDAMICDESTRIKSYRGKQSKAIWRLGKRCPVRVIMTGTLIPNNPLDAFGQMRFLDQSVFGEYFTPFRNKYCITRQLGRNGPTVPVGFRNLDDMNARINAVAMRKMKRECLDLPEKTFTTIPVKLSSPEQNAYDYMKERMIVEFGDGTAATAPIILTKLLRLQQITSGFIKDENDDIRRLGASKLDALADLLEDLDLKSRKVVIWAKFVEDIMRLAELLEGLKIGARLLFSATSSRATEIVKAFQEDDSIRALVGHPASGGMGITLHAADVMVFFSMDYSLGLYRQAQDRIHRHGQKNTCTYIHLTAVNTIDSVILRALKRKEDLASRVVDLYRRTVTVEGQSDIA